MTIGWCFDNTYYKLPNSFKENIKPIPVKKPELIILNKNLTKELNLDFQVVNALYWLYLPIVIYNAFCK